jgi:5,5'-dehydrodivanillate O-demethylase oxygenase subunit
LNVNGYDQIRGTRLAREAWDLRFDETDPNSPGGRLIRRFWQPIFVSGELPCGKAKPLQILDECFTIYRGQSGAPHRVDFRCKHRGTQLTTGWVEGNDIRCLYNGWKYGAYGLCVEQPGGFADKVRIRSFPLRLSGPG